MRVRVEALAALKASGNGWVVVLALAAAVQLACAGSASLSTTAPDTPKCQVSVGAPSGAIPSAGASGSVAVTTTRDCTWDAASAVSWIAITSAHSGQGSGTVTYRVDANTQPVTRHGAIEVNGSSVTVSQDAAPCGFAVSPPNAAVSASGGSVNVSVQTIAGCKWTATADEAWTHVASSPAGDGPATIRFAVDANPGPARIGHARIADQTIAIQQAEETPPATPTPAPAPGPTPAPAPTPAPTPTPVCHYSLASNNQSVPPAGGSNTVQLETDKACAWTATSNATWLSITSGASGTGSGAVAYVATANTGAARTGTLTIAGQTLTVTQASAPTQTCIFAIAPSALSVDATGGNGTVAVTSTAGCAWTAASNAAWIVVSNGASGSGNGSVSFTVAANTGTARTGTLTIAGQTFTVTQAAPLTTCSYAIAPASQAVDAGGANGTVAVTSGTGCTWTAASTAAWIVVSSGASGSGNGSVSFTVAANTGVARTGTLTIAGQTFTVTQAAPVTTCSYAIAPASQVVDATGGSGTVTVTSGTGCAWTAASTVAWIAVSSGASGTGNGSVGFTVAANTGTARTGSLTIAGQTFTVSQAAAPTSTCTYTIAPASATIAVGGGAAGTSVTTDASCTWTATSGAGWITITTGASGTGNGSVSMSVAPNTTGATRSGTATIAGQTFTVTQSGS